MTFDLCQNNESASQSMVGKVLHDLEDQYGGTPLYAYHESILRDSAGVTYVGTSSVIWPTLVALY